MKYIAAVKANKTESESPQAIDSAAGKSMAQRATSTSGKLGRSNITYKTVNLSEKQSVKITKILIAKSLVKDLNLLNDNNFDI